MFENFLQVKFLFLQNFILVYRQVIHSTQTYLIEKLSDMVKTIQEG